LALAPPGAGNSIPCTVEQVELLGHESLLHLRAGNDLLLISRIDGMTDQRVGAGVAVAFAPGALHFFGPDGVALRH